MTWTWKDTQVSPSSCCCPHKRFQNAPKTLPAILFFPPPLQPFPHYAFFLFLSLSLQLNFPLHGPVQCALLTHTPQSQCPSPTSAHTNLSALTRVPTFARPALSSSLTPRTRKSTMGVRRGRRLPWPWPMNLPLSPNPNLEVILHGSSNPGCGQYLSLSNLFFLRVFSFCPHPKF